MAQDRQVMGIGSGVLEALGEHFTLIRQDGAEVPVRGFFTEDRGVLTLPATVDVSIGDHIRGRKSGTVVEVRRLDAHIDVRLG
ncbi:MAG TPA: hypothetical protein VNO30_35370 [Kofleriaceae bacterium]|nr:hypothetical protein [Kofleriaceae bacterium]